MSNKYDLHWACGSLRVSLKNLYSRSRRTTVKGRRPKCNPLEGLILANQGGSYY